MSTSEEKRRLTATEWLVLIMAAIGLGQQTRAAGKAARPRLLIYGISITSPKIHSNSDWGSRRFKGMTMVCMNMPTS